MVDTELLESKIEQSGKKKGYLAKRCNLSRAGFRNCVINKANFTYWQVRILCAELNITDPKEERTIFFKK